MARLVRMEHVGAILARVLADILRRSGRDCGSISIERGQLLEELPPLAQHVVQRPLPQEVADAIDMRVPDQHQLDESLFRGGNGHPEGEGTRLLRRPVHGHIVQG